MPSTWRQPKLRLENFLITNKVNRPCPISAIARSAFDQLAGLPISNRGRNCFWLGNHFVAKDRSRSFGLETNHLRRPINLLRKLIIRR